MDMTKYIDPFAIAVLPIVGIGIAYGYSNICIQRYFFLVPRMSLKVRESELSDHGSFQK